MFAEKFGFFCRFRSLSRGLFFLDDDALRSDDFLSSLRLDFEHFKAQLLSYIFFEFLHITRTDLPCGNKYRIGTELARKAALIVTRTGNIEFLTRFDIREHSFLFLDLLDHFLRELDGIHGHDHQFDFLADLGREIVFI